MVARKAKYSVDQTAAKMVANLDERSAATRAVSLVEQKAATLVS